jgi:hypothetical protein
MAITFTEHLWACRYKEAFDDSEFVSTMPYEDDNDDDSLAESEWGAPAAGDDESDVESARERSKESKDNGKAQ